MQVIENNTGKRFDEVMAVTRRDNNKKRNYLLLNKLQAKYIPVQAKQALDMFDRLADAVSGYHGNIVVVGFAETATAIGARIAYKLSEDIRNKVSFITTTRENMEYPPVAEFKEEHSHAVEQALFGNKQMFLAADYVIFAEDELTTGNTICNLVKELNFNCKYIAASILNCMSDTELERFQKNDISAHWLIKTDKGGLDGGISGDSTNIYYPIRLINSRIYGFGNGLGNIGGIHNPRNGVNAMLYHKACEKIAEWFYEHFYAGQKMLVLGTEECMYPSIVFAQKMEEQGICAVVESTTRVPTCIGDKSPLTNRYRVDSLYGDRETYLYNLEAYDVAVIITDGHGSLASLLSALYHAGTSDIRVITLP